MVKYEEIVSIPNIEKIYHTIRTNTKHKEKILRFEMYYMMYINHIHNILLAKEYHHSRYNIFVIAEPKYRVIMSENLIDKVINHIIADNVLKPKIEPKLIPMNVATREKKGTKMGDYYIRKYINRLKQDKEPIYALKCDIRKYFYSINHERLKEKIRKIIQEQEFLKIIDEIIDSTDSQVNENIVKAIEQKKKREKLTPHQIEQLDSIPLYQKGRGLAIGNMTSQLFAIYYLNDLDHYIKEQLKAKYYIRYMDDFIILSKDKEYLKECFAKIKLQVAKEDLQLNAKSCIINLKEGLTFLGYRYILKKNKLIVRLRNQTKKRITKKLKKLAKKEDKSDYIKVKASYWGYLKKANANAYIQKYGWYQKEKKNKS